MAKRVSIPKAQQLRIFFRDSWHCRYCLKPVFFSPTLKLFEELTPGHSYYHRNAKTGKMLPLFQWTWASADHVKPVTRFGENSEPNLVTACWECNLKKRDSEIGEDQIKSITDEIRNLHWDGLCSMYPKVIKKDDGLSRLIKKYIKTVS